MDIIRCCGYARNVRLSNGKVELVATLDVGPRILRLGVAGGRNVFKVYPDQMGKAGEKTWRIRGGHRLWVAPEHPTEPQYADNGPVDLGRLGQGGIRLRSAPEKGSGIRKEIDIFIHPKAPRIRLVHRLRNVGLRTLRLAPWALSVMAPGGTAIAGLPPRGTHPRDLVPNQAFALWPYTDLADPRLTLGTRAILLRQKRGGAPPLKIGFSNPEGWAAYAVHECLFVKRFPFVAGAAYPDFGSSTELFTNNLMLELESLGPMVTVAPGRKVEHVEEWFLFAGVPPIRTEDDVDRHVRPLVARTS